MKKYIIPFVITCACVLIFETNETNDMSYSVDGAKAKTSIVHAKDNLHYFGSSVYEEKADLKRKRIVNEVR